MQTSRSTQHPPLSAKLEKSRAHMQHSYMLHGQLHVDRLEEKCDAGCTPITSVELVIHRSMICTTYAENKKRKTASRCYHVCVNRGVPPRPQVTHGVG